MSIPDPRNRLGKPIPLAESAADFTLDGAKEASRNCERCGGEGFTSVYNPRYRGDTVEIEVDPEHGKRQVLMRVNAFCLCPAGRKIAMLNQQTSKDFFLRTPDLHDVIAGKHHNWVADDPSERELTQSEVETLPTEFRRLLAERMRVTSGGRDRINRMFDE